MSEDAKPQVPFVPFISYTLLGDDVQHGIFKDVPTYISSCRGWHFGVTIEGKIEGQSFAAKFPVSFSNQGSSLYLSIDFSLQGLTFYERLNETDGPKYALRYAKQEPEPRDDARLQLLRHLSVPRIPEGRFVFDTDEGINQQHLDRLKAVTAYLKPTFNELYRLNLKNLESIRNTIGKGSIDGLVVPQA